MKPSFALDFRDGVISLLHRTTRGWQQVGASPLDAPDLGDALTYLRSTALGLSPRGLTTKLVIPNEMILYTQVHAPGPDVSKRRKQIRLALEGLTPYKVEDLVFDWWGNGTEVEVAVVARATLAEAEAFAVEHRFNPVSFVGAPETGNFMGEPFFGASALSATLLTEGEKVDRDQDPVSVMVREYGKTAAPTVPVTAPIDDAVVPPVVTDPVAAPAMPEAEAPMAPIVKAKVETPAAEPVVIPTPESAKVATPVKAQDPLPDFRAAKAPAQGVAGFDPAKMALDLVDEAPMAVDVSDDSPPPPFNPAHLPPVMAPAAKTQPVAAPPVPNPPVPTLPVPAPPTATLTASATSGTASQTTAKSVEAETDSDVPPSPSSAVIAAFASRRAAAEASIDKARKPPALGGAPQQRPSVPRPVLAKPAPSLPGSPRDTVPFPAKGAAITSKFVPPRGTKPLNQGQPVPQIKRDLNVVQLPKTLEDEDEALPAKPFAKTATGLDGRPVAPRGKPRYLGLILTALLLIALALLAAWSSYFLTANEPDPGAVPAATGVASAPATIPDAATADTTTGDATTGDTAIADGTAVLPSLAVPDATASGGLPSIEDEALADGQDPAAVDEVIPDAAVPVVAETAATETPAPAALLATGPTADVVPQPEPAPATLVTTEAAAVSTAGDEPQDEIFLASADAPPQTSDPLSLPQIASNTDAAPDAATPPPPFGTQYTFDAEGRIQPTPEGIMTPEGVFLIAGAPKIVPPTRPAPPAATAPATAIAAAPANGSTASPLANSTAEPLPAETFAYDPALAGKRPKLRPQGFVGPESTTAKQGEVLAPDANSRFASVRPQSRPAAMTSPATEVAVAEVSNDAAAASLALNGVQPSALAISVSKKPAARPSGMNQAVNAAVAAALRTPEPEQQVAAAAPEAQAEPEVETAAPAMPSNASVAKQATTKDAINLSRVALLGIFGTASGRYAMIRQPAGGVKKVKVGDSIDGGRIAAISATAVQYQKGGRMLTLALPI